MNLARAARVEGRPPAPRHKAPALWPARTCFDLRPPTDPQSLSLSLSRRDTTGPARSKPPKHCQVQRQIIMRVGVFSNLTFPYTARAPLFTPLFRLFRFFLSLSRLFPLASIAGVKIHVADASRAGFCPFHPGCSLKRRSYTLLRLAEAAPLGRDRNEQTQTRII